MTDEEYIQAREELRAARHKYNEDHVRCPECGHDKTCQTYVGYIWVMGREAEHKDENRASCKCGWVGVVHDLKPR